MNPNSNLPAQIDIRFSNISYTIPAGKRTLFNRSPKPSHTILHDVSGHVRPGESMAILGPSGSGKTTLLNLLAGRGEYAPSAGAIEYNGRGWVPRTKRKIGYVMQDDVFFSNLTVREVLDFTVDVRLSGHLDLAARRARVDDVLRQVQLEKCQHTRVGNQQFSKGISGGERKRLNIANELLHKPGLLLADECTSGLDSSSACTVVRLLRKLCEEHCTVVASIHQPSSDIFALFSKVILLGEGHVVYFGPPDCVVRHFESLGFPFPSRECNPPEFALQIIAEGNKVVLQGGSGENRVETTRHTGERSEHVRTLDMLITAWSTRCENMRRANCMQAVASKQDFVMTIDSGNNGKNETSPRTGTGKGDEGEVTGTSLSSKKAFMTWFRKPAEQTSTNSIDQIYFNPPSTTLERMKRSAWKRAQDVTGRHGADGIPDKYATNFFSQTRTLIRRSIRQKQGKIVQLTQIARVVLISFLSALLWFRLPAIEDTVKDRLGLITFFCIFWGFNCCFDTLFAFPAEKDVVNKDRASGTYRLSAYFIAKSFAEVLIDAALPIFSVGSVYYVVGLNPDGRSFIIFMIIILLHVMVSQGVGIFFSAWFLDIRNSQIGAMIYITFSLLTSGFYIETRNIPQYVRPLRYINFMKYAFEALVQTEVSFDRKITCTGSNITSMYSDYGKRCPIDRVALLKGAGIDTSISVLGNIIVLVVFIIITRIFGYVALKLRHTNHKPRRSH